MYCKDILFCYPINTHVKKLKIKTKKQKQNKNRRTTSTPQQGRFCRGTVLIFFCNYKENKGRLPAELLKAKV